MGNKLKNVSLCVLFHAAELLSRLWLYENFQIHCVDDNEILNYFTRGILARLSKFEAQIIHNSIMVRGLEMTIVDLGGRCTFDVLPLTSTLYLHFQPLYNNNITVIYPRRINGNQDVSLGILEKQNSHKNSIISDWQNPLKLKIFFQFIVPDQILWF